MPTRPLLACKVTNITTLSYPLLATPKIDGIRALRLNNTLLSRSFKEIPNDYIRNYLTTQCPDGTDGELILLDASFHETQSGVMSEAGIPEFRYLVFDYCPHGLEGLPYESRLGLLQGIQLPDMVSRVPTTLIYEPEQLALYEEECLKAGWEGVCLRVSSGTYKSGRSTLREHILLKLKRFEDAEAKVVGFQELERNGNVPTISELGLLKRSHAQSGKQPAQTLGALIVEDCRTGIRFNIGTGFTSKQREEFWNDQETLRGRLVTYKHQPYGRQDKPRIPVFKGFRNDLDL